MIVEKKKINNKIAILIHLSHLQYNFISLLIH